MDKPGQYLIVPKRKDSTPRYWDSMELGLPPKTKNTTLAFHSSTVQAIAAKVNLDPLSSAFDIFTLY